MQIDGYQTDDAAALELLNFLWGLCLVMLAPAVFVAIRGLYRWIYGEQGPTWIERQTGMNLDSADEGAEPMLLALPGYKGRFSTSAPDVDMSILAVGAPELPAYLPLRVMQLMRAYNAPWCICGGWAIDLFLGGLSRDHDDIEVAVLYRDQKKLRSHILGWQPRYAVPGASEQRPWQEGEWLKPPIHELHTKPPQADVRELEILLNHSAGDDWVYRRDEQVRLPLEKAIRFSANGIPYLAPETVLLYKSKAMRERDRADFRLAAPALDDEARAWLIDALAITAPDHPWLDRLQA